MIMIEFKDHDRQSIYDRVIESRSSEGPTIVLSYQRSYRKAQLNPKLTIAPRPSKIVVRIEDRGFISKIVHKGPLWLTECAHIARICDRKIQKFIFLKFELKIMFFSTGSLVYKIIPFIKRHQKCFLLSDFLMLNVKY